MKLQLIFPKNDLGGNKRETLEDSIKSSSISQGIPFLGQLYLAAQVRKQLGWDVEVFCEDYTSKAEIISQLDADFIGVTSWFNNHENALSYLQAAKQKGATTLIGGPNVSALKRKILDNNKFVDHVFVSDAENSLVGVLRGLDNRRVVLIDQLPDLDKLPLIDLDDLVDNQVLIEQSDRVSMYTSAIRGCPKAVTRGRCTFCSIPLKGLRLMSPERFFQQIRLMQEKYGFVNFTETGDDLVIPEYLDALLAEKPVDLEFSLYSQMGLENISPEIAHKLRGLGLKIAGLGLETFSGDVMRKVNKSRDHISEQIKYLVAEGIKVRLYTLYGLPTENEESIDYTHTKLVELVEDCPEGSIVVRPKIAFPLPGSALFRDCLKREKLVGEYNERTGQDLEREDKIDHLLLRDLYVKHFTSLSVDAIDEMVQQQKGRLPMEVRPLYL